MPGSRMRRDWANLPMDIVIKIGNKASTNRTYVHLRAVCKPWRRALAPHPCHLPRQFPWLMLPQLPHHNGSQDGRGDSRICFYDLSQSKTHWFELPSVGGKCICGSSYGWLVVWHSYNVCVSLLNPITGSTIDLPPINAIPNGQYCLGWVRNRQQLCTQKVVLTCSPSDPDCIVVACADLTSPDWELIFCRIGDRNWTGLKRRVALKYLLDFTIHNNSVYSVNSKKEVSVSNLQTLATWTYPATIRYYSARDRIHLVPGDGESDGPLVIKSPEYLGLRKINKFHVFKYIGGEWSQVRDIGNAVLFLTRDDCTKLQFEEEKGNELYYDRRDSKANYSYSVGINRVNLKSLTEVPHKSGPVEVFPVASGRLSWFTPSLT